MTGVITTNPLYQFSDSLGSPLVAGTLTVYLAGTTTPTNTWSNSALSVANTNPVILNSRGECVLWLDSAVNYKFLLKDSGGTTQWTVDNIRGGDSYAYNLAILLAASGGSNLIGFLQSGTGAVARTAQDKMRESVSVKDFGAVGDGTTNDTAAIQSAIDSVGRNTGAITRISLWFPPGTYLLNTQLEIQQQSVAFLGTEGTILKWNGNNTTAMVHIKDSTRCTFDTLAFMGLDSSQPTAAIYAEEPTGSSLGTNEYFVFRNTTFGRLYTQQASPNGKLQRGIWFAGASNTNNDTFYIEQCQFHDCTTAGLALDNAQSIWGSVKDTLFNACGYGIYTGSNLTCYNASFNRCTISDLYAFRDITVSMFGMNAENSVVCITGSQGASFYVYGGKLTLGTLMVGTSWCSIASGNFLMLDGLQVIQNGVSGKLLSYTGASANAGYVRIKSSLLPNGDDGSGFAFSSYTNNGVYIDIAHGPYVVQEFTKYKSTYDAPSIADGSSAQGSATITGVVAGDLSIPSLDVSLAGMLITGGATSTNTLTARLFNKTGGPIDLASANLMWRYFKNNNLKAVASAVYDQPSVANTIGSTTTVTVPGASLGDFVAWSQTSNWASACVTAYVSAANTVSVRFQNQSGGALDPASGTLTCAVIRETGDYIGAVVYDPPSLASLVATSVAIPVPGASLGDYVLISFSLDLQGISVAGYVESSGSIRAVFYNGTAGVLDLASGNLRAMVFKRIG